MKVSRDGIQKRREKLGALHVAAQRNWPPCSFFERLMLPFAVTEQIAIVTIAVASARSHLHRSCSADAMVPTLITKVGVIQAGALHRKFSVKIYCLIEC